MLLLADICVNTFFLQLRFKLKPHPDPLPTPRPRITEKGQKIEKYLAKKVPNGLKIMERGVDPPPPLRKCLYRTGQRTFLWG